ncbi:fibronectin type III domain-containing protein [Neobacillus bataviensis]|uniref:fibronectin type III domain-containing protein n=1 Tax=Neobacillus bataviensis TaxID=220685 RepID=UPI001CC0879B|nr:fibronectin type III domain-containing protein [Neobacillus bataviensis]
MNQDGIINETDMKFLVKNLYKSNPDATVKPKEAVADKYSTDYFNELGIASTINTLKNTAESKNTVSLSWIAAVNATEVKIEQSNDNGVTWSTSTTEQPVTVSSNNAVVTGLSENNSYQFRVKVVGGLNAGISNVVKVITEDALASKKK